MTGLWYAINAVLGLGEETCNEFENCKDWRSVLATDSPPTIVICIVQCSSVAMKLSAT